MTRRHSFLAAGWPSTPRALGLVLAGSVAVRVAAVLYFGNDIREMPGVADERSYQALAIRVLDGHGFSFAEGWWPATPAGEPTAHWSFLYVLLLAGVYGLAGPEPLAARLVQAAFVGLLQPYLAWRIGRRLFDDRAGLAAAGLTAAYGYFIYYAAALMTEALYMTALLASLDIALRLGDRRERPAWRPRAWIGLGAAMAAAVLLRQAFLLCVPLVVGWLAWRALRPSGSPAVRLRTTLAGAGLALLVVGLAILPWTLRNQRVFGAPVLLNTNAGFAFFWGNHPVHGYRFQPLLDGPEYGALIPDGLRGLNEAALDRALLEQGLAFARDEPLRYASLTAGRLIEFVKFWPTPESGAARSAVRLLSFGVALPLFAVGLVLALRPRGRDETAGGGLVWLPILVAAGHAAVYVLTWTLVRYRLPVDAMLMPFAGLALAAGAARLNVPAVRPPAPAARGPMPGLPGRP